MEGGKTAYMFTINALSHCDWRDCPERLVEQAQGKTVLLVAEEDNVDPHAVRVHFGGKVARNVLRRFFSGIAILMFFKQHGLLQTLPDQQTVVGVPNVPNAQSLSGLDRLANQINVLLGQNPTTSY